MGVSLFHSCSSSPYAQENSNPNPERYKILRHEVINKNLLLLIEYPDCKNFEGTKLLLYKGIDSIDLLLNLTNKKIDPHFFADKISPFARFRPTLEGLKAANILAYLI